MADIVEKEGADAWFVRSPAELLPSGTTCKKCGSKDLVQEKDILDVWFDSGSMSFAQNHVPFENADWFEHHFPADFIVEYINQTRGWFYTLHILATAIFDRPAFENCISHGIVKKMPISHTTPSVHSRPTVLLA